LQQQGRVLDASGLPVDGSHDITFAIYDAPGATTPAWSETDTLTFVNGYFSTALGDGSSPLTSELFGTDDLWLGLQIDADPELPLRTPLHSVPFAIHADTASNVSGGAVVLGDSGGTCSASEEGTVRYLNDTFEGCTSGGWVVLGVLTQADPFSFVDQFNVARSTLTLSNIVQINGLNTPTSVSINGVGNPSARSCSDASCSSVVQTWTNALSISNSEYLQVRQTSSAGLSTVQSTTVSVGGASDIWSVTTIQSEVITAGQQAYTTPGTYSWTAPSGVTSVSVVAVGGGGGGGRYTTPGQTPGGDSYFISPSIVRGGGGGNGVNSFGTFTGDGGGNGGYSNTSGTDFSGGGGAGGYTGNGG
jgi:hypothetical protein